MPQLSIGLLNKTLEDPAYNPALALTSLESSSVRLTALQKGSYVEVYGFNWGATASASDLNSGSLLVIRNEIFDPFFQYGNPVFRRTKDIIFEDRIDFNEPFRNIDFTRPLKLNDAANYLIIICGFASASITISTQLTVRGNLIQENETYFGNPR